jgi:putative ABC transport system ATP-binding protein
MSGAPAAALFDTRGLCKCFRQGAGREVRALQDVSLTVAARSFTALTGPSGCGKTTLLAVLGALERPTSGQVLFRGRDLGTCSDAELARARRRMGFVFQDFSLIPGLSVWENVTYPLIPRGVRRAQRHARARGLLNRLGLGDRLLARPGDLSGGEQQRVALARALAGEPEVLLADEPTSNLDPEAGQTVLAILQEVHATGRTVVLASHDALAVGLATCTYELDKGRISRAAEAPTQAGVGPREEG